MKSDVRVLHSLEEARSLMPAWEALLDDAERPEPVVTPQWFRAWWSVFGDDGRQLRLAAIEDGEHRLIGLAPFARRTFWYRGGIPFRRLELLPSGEARTEEICSEYLGVIVRRGCGPRVAHSLANALVRRALGSWDELLMPALNGDDPFAEQLAGALRDLGSRVEIASTGACPYITLPTTWEGYLEKLPKKRRYGVRRTLKDFHAWVGDRPWEIHGVESTTDLARGVGILKSLHGERWDGEGAFRSTRFSRFHERVMADLAAGRGGSLELLWIEVAGVPVAAAYNIVYRGKVYFYQSGRSLGVPKAVRAGVVMQLLAIRRAIERGRIEYDFLGGASVYKRQLAIGSRDLVTLRAVAPSPRARALEAVRAAAERVARFAR